MHHTTDTRDHSKCIEVMNDLVEINNDRIDGYQRAIDGLDGESGHLTSVYSRMKDQSHKLNEELKGHIQTLGGTYEEENTILGSIHHAWMDIKQAFRSDDAEASLESSDFGEEAAQKAYDLALEADIHPETRDLITRQQAELRQSHQEIKNLKSQVENR